MLFKKKKENNNNNDKKITDKFLVKKPCFIKKAILFDKNIQ